MANEPVSLVAGDTAEWEENFSDYAASDSWVLTYEFRGSSTLQITGVADGDAFDLTITAAESAALIAGVYSYQAYVTKSGERHTVSQGTLTVGQNLAAMAAGYESRSHAQKCLDLIEAAIESYAERPVTQITLPGRGVVRTDLGKLVMLRNHYQWEVKMEVRRDKIARGQNPGGKIEARFTEA